MEKTSIRRVRRATAKRTKAHDEWVAAIRAALADGCTVRQVGEAAGISGGYVSRLARGKRG